MCWCRRSGFCILWDSIFARTFAIVTAAGLGNLPGVITMSFILGWVEQYAGIIAGAGGTRCRIRIDWCFIMATSSMRRQRQVVR